MSQNDNLKFPESVSHDKKILSIIIIVINLLLWSRPSRQHSKVQYRWGIRRRGKMGKNGKVGESGRF